MMQRANRFKTLFAQFFELVRGPKVLSEVENNGVLQTTLTGMSIRGFVINITCTQSTKNCIYKRRWIRDRLLYTYEVTATYEGTPPEPLKEPLSKVLHFPDILAPWMTHAAQREAAISAYLDIVISQLPSRGQKKLPIGA